MYLLADAVNTDVGTGGRAGGLSSTKPIPLKQLELGPVWGLRVALPTEGADHAYQLSPLCPGVLGTLQVASTDLREPTTVAWPPYAGSGKRRNVVVGVWIASGHSGPSVGETED